MADYVCDRRFSFRDGSCFIQHNRIYLMTDFQSFATLNQNTMVGTESSSHHDCCRCCKTECARTCDDQHGNKDGKYKCDVKFRKHQSPDNRRNHCNGHNGWHEITCHCIRQLGNRCFLTLCIFHHFYNLSQGCVRTNMGNFYNHRTLIVDTSANHFVIYSFFHRNTFSGQHRLIHTGTAFHYDSVKWNSAARFNQNHLIYGNLRYRNFHLFSITKNNRRIRS